VKGEAAQQHCKFWAEHIMTSSGTANAASQSFASGAIKVPAVTALFWAIKILTTGMGETTSDYLVGAMNPKIAVLGGAASLVAALLVQWLWPRFHAPIYWGAVLMVGIFGTMAADVTHRVIGVPYSVSSLAFALGLAGAFWLWQKSEGTLSIHSVRGRRREAFYWAVVLLTFALGTALGDLSAHSWGLGYFPSALLYGLLILLPLIAYRRFGLGEIAAFWCGYVITRPLGASFADWFGAPVERGGMGYGFGSVSAVLFVIFVALVAYVTLKGDGMEQSAR
jgi:uncharacterized membrane-anchored protein